MTQYFPIIVEREGNGTFSKGVAGLPGVNATADTADARETVCAGCSFANSIAGRRLRFPAPAA